MHHIFNLLIHIIAVNAIVKLAIQHIKNSYIRCQPVNKIVDKVEI